MMNIGTCSAFKVELWGVLQGLKMAWDLGFKKATLETDSKAVLQTLQKKEETQNHPEALVRSIGQILKRDWQLNIKHVYREANRSADWLAKNNLEVFPGFHFIELPHLS
ncbi:hypothetical protein AHAS_Ahas13G0477600 [Arachis hypogaea]